MNYGVQAPPNPWAVLDREIAWYTRRQYQDAGPGGASIGTYSFAITP